MLAQREAEFQREFLHGVVVRQDFGTHFGEALAAGVGNQVFHQQRADALPVQMVGNHDAEFAAAHVCIGGVAGVGERVAVFVVQDEGEIALVVGVAHPRDQCGGQVVRFAHEAGVAAFFALPGGKAADEFGIFGAHGAQPCGCAVFQDDVALGLVRIGGEDVDAA